MLYIQNYKNTESSLQEFIIYAHSEKMNSQKNCSYVIKFSDVLVQFNGITIFGSSCKRVGKLLRRNVITD